VGLGRFRDPRPEALPGRREERGAGVQLVEPVRGVCPTGAGAGGDHESAAAAGRGGSGDGIGAPANAPADEHACGGVGGAGPVDGVEPVPEQPWECCGAVGSSTALGADLGPDPVALDASEAASSSPERLIGGCRTDPQHFWTATTGPPVQIRGGACISTAVSRVKSPQLEPHIFQ